MSEKLSFFLSVIVRKNKNLSSLWMKMIRKKDILSIASDAMFLKLPWKLIPQNLRIIFSKKDNLALLFHDVSNLELILHSYILNFAAWNILFISKF